MYYTLYIDELFLENLLLDYFLLTVIGRVLKLPAGRLRRLLGAALGSLGLCLLYVFSLERTWIGAVLLYGAIAGLMVGVGLHPGSRGLFGKAAVLLYLCSFLLGGIFQWLQTGFSVPAYPFLFFSLISFWILSAGMNWLMRLQRKESRTARVTLYFHGRNICLKGLFDTGNALRDPVFGKPVSILEEKRQKELCQGEEVIFYPIPFHSIGKSHGLLPAFYADSMRLELPDGRQYEISRPLLGVTKEPLSSEKEYEIILHPETVQETAETGQESF